MLASFTARSPLWDLRSTCRGTQARPQLRRKCPAKSRAEGKQFWGGWRSDLTSSNKFLFDVNLLESVLLFATVTLDCYNEASAFGWVFNCSVPLIYITWRITLQSSCWLFCSEDLLHDHVDDFSLPPCPLLPNSFSPKSENQWAQWATRFFAWPNWATIQRAWNYNWE